MYISVLRPARWRSPRASRNPRSPVSNQPFSSMASAVSSGSCQYPRITARLRKHTVPTSVSPESVVATTRPRPSSSRSSISTPEPGVPTVLQITSSGSSREVPVETHASVLVYRTTTGDWKRSRMASTISGGMRAAPEETMRSEDVSAVANWGRANIICH